MPNTKHHGIDLDAPAIREFCRKWKIAELSVFGSVLRDDFGPHSDVDILVDAEPDADWSLFDQMDMQDELAKIFGRDVDLLTRGGLESSSNWLLKREIFASLERVHVTR